MTYRRFASLLAPLFVSTLLSGCHTAQLSRNLAEAPAPPIAWIELGPDAAVIARVITGEADCPKIQLDGAAGEAVLPTSLRAAPDSSYPVRVCEAVIPSGVRSARLEDLELPLPAANPHKILFAGDTGCRLLQRSDGKFVAQSCNDPMGWPFPRMVRAEASSAPDLVVHLGDYLYREAPCPAGNNHCAGSPSGNNWETWNADFFDPAGPLLRKAPWVFVRGNHELCSRAGEGWFRFLDPRPYSACSDTTDPYLVRQGGTELVVLDSAVASDLKAQDDQVRLYQRQFAAISAMPLHHAWLVTHRPLWAPLWHDAKDPSSPIDNYNLTMQTASGNKLPASIETVFAGHLHLFEDLHFADGRAPQIVAGNGGTQLNEIPKARLIGSAMAGTTITEGLALSDFGYLVVERRADGGWDGTGFDSQGAPKLACPGRDHAFHCSAK